MYRPIKKFIYPPGFISLLLLPICCVFYLQQQQLQEKQHVWPMLLCQDSVDCGFEQHVYNTFHPKRRFIDFELSGKEFETKQKLAVAQLKIRELITSHDSANGIHFQLDSTVCYKTLINILAICKKEKAEHYTIHRSDIWVFNLCIDCDKLPIRECGRIDSTYIPTFDNRNEIESSQQLQQEQSELINTTWSTIKLFSISIFLFLVMTLLSYHKVKKMSIVSRFNAHQRD